MIRIFVSSLFWVFVGVLVGEIPTGRTTVGRTAWDATHGLLTKSGQQLESWVSYAGLGSVSTSKWLGKLSNRSAPKQSEEDDADSEGLTPTDRQALQKILE